MTLIYPRSDMVLGLKGQKVKVIVTVIGFFTLIVGA